MSRCDLILFTPNSPHLAERKLHGDRLENNGVPKQNILADGCVPVSELCPLHGWIKMSLKNVRLKTKLQNGSEPMLSIDQYGS
jgi:hypothetical protein